MSEEILINVTPQETRVALVENGVIQELWVERSRSRGLVGNIYKGVVSRVLPGMQAAFVDIGLERAAFLHASDISHQEVEGVPTDVRREEPITELLHEGQEILVQVIKDPLGTKGARLTTHVTIPSRYLVFMPDAGNVGVSQRIDDDTERARLKEIICQALGGQGGGFIVRTAADGVAAEVLQREIAFLRKLWVAVGEQSREARPRSIIHADLPLALRAMRDLVHGEIEKIRIDSRETYLRARQFAEELIPEVVDRLEYYPGERPLFDLHNIEDEIQRALERKVPLKSGGYVIVDQTEAMTTIDVNTGAYLGHRNLEETIFKTNLEAAQAIARQLRLRNLGGIIIIDFIDMIDADHRRQVLRALERALERDHAKSHIGEITSLGLVQMTRKRTRESLEHTLCAPCPVCLGRGTLKTPETICYEIFREILREARQYDDAQSLLVLASQEVIDLLLDEESTSLAELESFVDKPIKLQVEALYNQEQYDVVLL